MGPRPYLENLNRLVLALCDLHGVPTGGMLKIVEHTEVSEQTL